MPAQLGVQARFSTSPLSHPLSQRPLRWPPGVWSRDVDGREAASEWGAPEAVKAAKPVVCGGSPVAEVEEVEFRASPPVR